MFDQDFDSFQSSVSLHSPSVTSTPRSSMAEMSIPQRSSSTDSTADNIRKRVCKACDRCRLKKSKCDGANPCSRCKADNAICVFGERKKSHDKVYPKGYVEMLEQQQSQLVSGLQELYRRLLNGQRWSGAALSEASGHPLTHDILAALNLLEVKHDGSGDMESFEEDVQKLQSRLYSAGAPYMRRKGSFSSESNSSQHDNARSTAQSTPSMTKAQLFKETFSFTDSPPSSAVPSPTPRKRQSYPPAHPSPLHRDCQLANDPQLFQPDWDLSNPGAIMRSKFAMMPPHIMDEPDTVADIIGTDEWAEANAQYDLGMNSFSSYAQPIPNLFSGLSAYSDVLDPMEIEFNKWVQVGG